MVDRKSTSTTFISPHTQFTICILLLEGVCVRVFKQCVWQTQAPIANMKQLYFISIFYFSISFAILSRLNKIQIKIKCFPYILNVKRNRASLKRSHPVEAQHFGAKSTKINIGKEMSQRIRKSSGMLLEISLPELRNADSTDDFQMKSQNSTLYTYTLS